VPAPNPERRAPPCANPSRSCQLRLQLPTARWHLTSTKLDRADLAGPATAALIADPGLVLGAERTLLVARRPHPNGAAAPSILPRRRGHSAAARVGIRTAGLAIAAPRKTCRVMQPGSVPSQGRRAVVAVAARGEAARGPSRGTDAGRCAPRAGDKRRDGRRPW
jgi:hypothetical protein